MAKAKTPRPPTKKLRKEFFKAFDDVDAVAKYLDDGLDPNTMFQLDFDEPALAWALERGHLRIARLLLDRNIDVKLADPRGKTALHTVGDAAFARELIARGADVSTRDTRGRTPLHAACTNKHAEVVDVLIAAGAELEAADVTGLTPYAVASHAGIRAALRAAGAKPFGPGGGKLLAARVLDDQPRSAIDVARGAIGCDREGNLWTWGYGGMFRLAGDRLTKFEFDETFAVGNIAAGPGGEVYFGSNWGLLRYARGEFRLYSSEDSELVDSHLTFLATDPDGRAYMTSYEDHHIIVFDGETFSLLDDVPDMELERIRFDPRGEPILCGQGGYAIKRDGAWQISRKIDPGSPFESVVYDVVDAGDTLWIGTQSGVFERRGSVTTKHDVRKLAKHLLHDGDTVWVGTYFGGLARIRGGEVAFFDEKTSPLPNDDILGLTRAPDGTIWVHTSTGLATIRDGELQGFS